MDEEYETRCLNCGEPCNLTFCCELCSDEFTFWYEEKRDGYYEE